MLTENIAWGMKLIISGIGTLLIAVLHIMFPTFEQVAEKHRPQWTSLAGGVAIGYVFLYLLPKLSDYTSKINLSDQGGWEFLDYSAFFLALVGLVAYLAVYWSADNDKENLLGEYINGSAFCVYSFLTGYIIANIPRQGLLPIVLAVSVAGMHFLGIDHQLRHRNKNGFDRYLRWFMALSIITGWVLGASLHLPKSVLIYANSLFGGAIITNVMTEEIPEEGEGNRTFFIIGIFIFIVVAIIIRSFPRL